MSPLPIDPSFATTGADFAVPGIGGVSQPDGVQVTGSESAAGDGEGFGSMLAKQISNLERLQTEGAEASRALATGTAEDLPSVVAAVERARLSMELASSVRTRAVEAYQEIWRTQV